MALARTLSKEEFGSYQLVVSIIGVCGIFTLPGMQSVIIQSVARGFPGTYRSANFWSWRISGIGGLILVICAAIEWSRGQPEIAVALTAAGLLFPHSNGIANWQAYQNGKEEFKATAIYQGSSLVAGNGLIIAACAIGLHDLWIPIVVFYGVIALQNLRLTHTLLKAVPLDAQAEPGAMKYGFRTSLYNIVNVIANYLDRLLLFWLVSPEALAVFAVSDRAPELVKRNVQSILKVLVPELSRKSHYTQSLNRKLNLVGLTIGGCVLLGMFFVIPWLIPLLFTEKFADSVIYCQLLLISTCVGLFATMKFAYIQAKMDTDSARGVILTMSFCRIGFSIILVPVFGILGAAFATIAYRIVTFTVVSHYLRKYHMLEASSAAPRS